MHPANKLVNQRRRTNRARRFPDNTCPASRHVHLIADRILRGDTFEPEDREHIAGSLLSVLESLWKARTQLSQRGGTPQGSHRRAFAGSLRPSRNPGSAEPPSAGREGTPPHPTTRRAQ